MLTEQLSAASGTTITVPFGMHILSVESPLVVRTGLLRGITSSSTAYRIQLE